MIFWVTENPRLSKVLRWKNLAVYSRHLPSEKIGEGESEAREPLYTGQKKTGYC